MAEQLSLTSQEAEPDSVRAEAGLGAVAVQAVIPNVGILVMQLGNPKNSTTPSSDSKSEYGGQRAEPLHATPQSLSNA